MNSPRLTSRAVLGLALGALITCFAPVIHTLCVAPPADATHAFSHIMPDGQTMVMVDLVAPMDMHETADTSAVDSGANSAAPDATVFLSMLGVVLFAGGIALAAVAYVGARQRLAGIAARGMAGRRPTLAPPARAPAHNPFSARIEHLENLSSLPSFCCRRARAARPRAYACQLTLI